MLNIFHLIEKLTLRSLSALWKVWLGRAAKFEATQAEVLAAIFVAN